MNQDQQLDLALVERDRAIARVAAKNATFIETMRGVARMIARKQGTVTADDLRDHLAKHPELGQPTHYNAFGAVFVNNPDFVLEGYVKSRQKQGHGNLIRRWRLRGEVAA